MAGHQQQDDKRDKHHPPAHFVRQRADDGKQSVIRSDSMRKSMEISTMMITRAAISAVRSCR